MLEGITIISQTEITVKSGYIDVFVPILITALLVIIISSIELENNKYVMSKRSKWEVINIIGICVLVISLVLIIVCPKKEPIGKYEYRVIIDDTISLNELNERYEIIGYNDGIYTIRDK
ncbi:MAG: hypothetical protein E7265_10635 [Lachnospiraceae bacterium]|nr:hypothetical protein [Lachnospiraceae bacterium]